MGALTSMTLGQALLASAGISAVAGAYQANQASKDQVGAGGDGPSIFDEPLYGFGRK